MTIDQTNAILAAFERQRARCELQLAQLPYVQRAMTEYTARELAAASVLAVESEIEAWKKAAAIVRRVAGEHGGCAENEDCECNIWKAIQKARVQG